MKNESTKKTKTMALTSLLLVLFAVAAVTVASLAWLSVSDNAGVMSLGMDITAGPGLRIDLDAHRSFEDYTQSLSAEAIFSRIQNNYGFDPAEIPLDPVTTADCESFTLKNGTEVAETEGKYLSYTLHFMSDDAIDVYLSPVSSRDEEDGTLVSSTFADLPKAMRISFTIGDETIVYTPGRDTVSGLNSAIRTFTLASADSDEAYSDNFLFHLEKETDVAVRVHIWLEGTDEACTNALKSADYAVRMRFVGLQDGEIPNE